MDRFFGIAIQTGTIQGMSFALLLSVLLGGAVGLEREIHAHPAGLRTHILVCMGSCLITLVSVNMGHGSNDRISAQIVTGVGFLGAGAIIRDGASVRGLTTAATIWATAGIGIALGTSPFFGELAIIATVIVLFTLWVLNRIEDWLEDSGKRVLQLEVTVEDAPALAAGVLEQIRGCGARVTSVGFQPGSVGGTRRLSLHVALGSQLSRETLLAALLRAPGVIHAHLA